MIFCFNIDNDIKDNAELLTQFYPNYIANTKVIMKNDKTPLMRMIKKNSSVLSLINKLDLELVGSSL